MSKVNRDPSGLPPASEDFMLNQESRGIMSKKLCVISILLLSFCDFLQADEKAKSGAGPAWITTGSFHWKSTQPLISANQNAPEPEVALKDPSIVCVDNQWHLFATHRLVSGKVDMQYIKFLDWGEANHANATP